MIKKIVALLLALSTLMLSGCVLTLDEEPNGVRPDSIDGARLLPDFPPRSAISAEFNYLVSLVEEAEDIDSQREAYKNLQRAAFLYIMGPYSVANFITSNGGDISIYEEEMMTLLSDYLTNYDLVAWSAITSAPWGSELSAEFARGAITPDKVRNAFPVATADGQEMTTAVYNTREAIYEALEEGQDGETLAQLLNEALVVREDIAVQMDYDSYLSYCFLKRDNLPYTKDDMLTLAHLVRDNLSPVLASLNASEGLPALSAEEWNADLPELIERFPAFSEDLLYCLENQLLTVAEVAEDSDPKFFSYPLYQYDASIGRANIGGDFSDTLLVAGLLGSMARDMAVSSDQWALTEAQLSSKVQIFAFQNLFVQELDSIYGEQSDAATVEYRRLLLEETCRAAMEYELLYRIYEMETVTNDAVAALAEDLSAAYGLPLSAQDIYELEQLVMGTVDCAQVLLGSLAGAQLALVAEEDAALAWELFSVMLSVYNYGNPVTEAVQAGLANPYSSEAIQNLAQFYSK